MHKLQKSGSRERSMNILGNTVDKIGQFDQNPLFATHWFEKQLQRAFQCRDEKSLCQLSPEPDEIHENRRLAQNDSLQSMHFRVGKKTRKFIYYFDRLLQSSAPSKLIHNVRSWKWRKFVRNSPRGLENFAPIGEKPPMAFQSVVLPCWPT